MKNGAIFVALALALMAIGAATRAQGSTFDPSAGGSRAAAIRLENNRYEDQLLGFRMERRANQADCDKKILRAHGDSNMIKQARKELDAANDRVRAEEIDAYRVHCDNFDRISRYWDRQAGDPGRTNRIDGRNGRRYVDDVPKPALEPIYPTRFSRGQIQVKLPNGTWVPAKRGPNNRYVPANQ